MPEFLGNPRLELLRAAQEGRIGDIQAGGKLLLEAWADVKAHALPSDVSFRREEALFGLASDLIRGVLGGLFKCF